jgi:hypothetical protein
MVECHIEAVEVVGSSPIGNTTDLLFMVMIFTKVVKHL